MLFLKFKAFLKKFFLIHDTPHKIAAGAALGLFMGIIPGGVITTLVLASILRFNRLSAGIGALAFSVWTTALFLPPSAALGGFLFNTNTHDLASDINRIYQLGFTDLIGRQIWPVFLDLALPLIVGLFIVGSAVSLVFYLFLFRLLKNRKLKFK